MSFLIRSGNVISGTIGSSAVLSGSIGSGQISQFHIGSGAIVSGGIASGQIGRFHVSSGAVTSGAIGVTGTPTGTNFLRDDYSWAATTGLQTATFVFNHSTGTASTGAIGFTPKFCLYYGAISINGAGQVAIANGFATGVGAARANSFSFTEGPGSPQLPGMTAASASGFIGGESTPIQNTASFSTGFSIALSVTAFSSAGIDLTWSSTVNGHQGFLLVIG